MLFANDEVRASIFWSAGSGSIVSCIELVVYLSDAPRSSLETCILRPRTTKL